LKRETGKRLKTREGESLTEEKTQELWGKGGRRKKVGEKIYSRRRMRGEANILKKGRD